MEGVLEDVTFEEAFARMRANPAAHWPHRGETNRLEPECWPELRPSFAFEPGSRVFTIGSCFARNLETELARLGFRVPTLDFIADHPEFAETAQPGVMNRYTPPSIFQSLSWARGILDRDDQVRAEDVEPFLMEASDHRFLDLHRPGVDKLMTLDEALRDRQLLYGLWRQAFDCPTVVITLGLVECWWDRLSGTYVEFTAAMRRNPERFVFRRLDYPRAYDWAQATIDLLRRDARPDILITTSPVPMGRTFTGDDVIVANTYSKSVLRAVAGAVADANEKVDYFPSYETVMLTRQKEVWQADLRHVSALLVSEVMSRVTQAYAGVGADEAGPARRFVDIWAQGDRSAAAELFDNRLSQAEGSPRFHIAAAELAAHRGRDADARRHLDLALAGTSELQPVILRVHHAAAEILAALGDRASADEHRRRLMDAVRRRPIHLPWLRTLLRDGPSGAVAWAIEAIREALAGDARRLEEFGDAVASSDAQAALAIYRDALAAAPDHEDVLVKCARMLVKLNRLDEAQPFLERLDGLGCTHVVLARLADRRMRDGRREEARRLLERLAEANPEAEGVKRRLSRLSPGGEATG